MLYEELWLPLQTLGPSVTWVSGMAGVAGAVGNRSSVSDSVRDMKTVLLENSQRPWCLGDHSALHVTVSFDPCNDAVGVSSSIIPIFQKN